jgi:hypothetical protein
MQLRHLHALTGKMNELLSTPDEKQTRPHVITRTIALESGKNRSESGKIRSESGKIRSASYHSPLSSEYHSVGNS